MDARMTLRSQRNKLQDKCVYCGSSPKNMTRDHVPPCCVFPEPRPNLITVPCCYPCNHNSSRDDEYFRTSIVSSWESSDSPEAGPVIEKVVRSISRSEGGGPAKSILDTLEDCFVVDIDGSIEQSGTFHLEADRIGKVVSRTVLGLLWHETKLYLPDDYVVAVFPSYNIQQLGILDEHAMKKLLSKDPNTVGEGVFQYWWNQEDARGKCDSVWFLRFYRGIFFLCLVCQKAMMATKRFTLLQEEKWISVNGKASFRIDDNTHL